MLPIVTGVCLFEVPDLTRPAVAFADLMLVINDRLQIIYAKIGSIVM